MVYLNEDTVEQAALGVADRAGLRRPPQGEYEEWDALE